MFPFLERQIKMPSMNQRWIHFCCAEIKWMVSWLDIMISTPTFFWHPCGCDGLFSAPLQPGLNPLNSCRLGLKSDATGAYRGKMKLTSKPSLIHWCLLTEWRALALVIDCSYWLQIDEGGGRRQRRRQQLPHELDCVCFVKRNAADPDLSQDLVFLCFSIILDASASWLDLTASVVMPKPL